MRMHAIIWMKIIILSFSLGGAQVRNLRDQLRLQPADGFYLSGEPVQHSGIGVKGIIRQVPERCRRI